MKKYFLYLIFVFSAQFLFGQEFWQNELKNKSIFIENIGQTNENKLSAEILFVTEVDGIEIFFTKKGYFYKMKEYVSMSEEEIEAFEEKYEKKSKREKEKEEKEKEFEKNRFKKVQAHYVEINWLNSNPDCKILSYEKQNAYYTFPNSSGKASGFTRIVYSNLYENIDVEFLFPEGKKGFKYNYILKPGANLSQIKLSYENIIGLKKDALGNLVVETKWGEFMEHNPFTYDKEGANYKVAYELNEDELSFNASPKFQKNILSKQITIDPWVTVPNIPDEKKLFEIGKDSLNNVYVFGATSNATIQKYNENGVHQWTFNTTFDGTYWFGDMAVHPSGKAYLTWVGGVFEINNSGNLSWSDNGLNLLGENWRCSFNCDFSKLIVAMCSGSSNIQTIDIESHVVSPIIETFPTNGEIRALTKGLNGKFYGLTINDSPQIINLDYDLTPLYSVESRQQFNYADMTYNVWGGKNAIAANESFIFTYDGVKLSKRNILTGQVTDSTNIPDGIMEYNSGVDVDNCGNVFVGSQSKIYKLNSDLDVLSSVNTGQAVYDLCLGPNGGIFACGNNFVGLFDLQSCGVSTCSCLSASSTNASCFGGNQGTATIVTTGGIGPFSYLWDDGQTTATAVGLSIGEHEFTVTSNGGCSVSGTALVSSVNLEIEHVQTCTYDTVTCLSNNNGSIVLDVSEGSEPYNFEWNITPNQNNDSLIGIESGTYTVVVTDVYGCKDSLTTTVLNTNIPQVVVYIDSFSCQKYVILNIINVNYDSLYYYTVLWSNGSTSFYLPITANGTYSYTVTDPNSGCLLEGTGSIEITDFNQENVWSFDSIIVDKSCSGINSISFDVSDQTSLVYEYYDSFGNGDYFVSNDTTLFFNSDTLIYVYVYDYNFCKDTSIIISASNSFNASITGCNETICSGDSCQLIVNGVSNFYWLDSPFLSSTTNDSVFVNPNETDTFYLVVNENNCTDTISYIVQISPIPTAIITAPNFNCWNDTVSLFADSPGNFVAWTYNGLTFPQNPFSATNVGNYTAHIISPFDCKADYSVNIGIDSSPIASFFPNPGIGEVPLTVNFSNTSQFATSYQWNFDNGAISESINPNTVYTSEGSYTIQLIAYSSIGCTDITYQTIIVFKDTICKHLELVIPNIFTVSQDLINENFIITSFGDYEFDFKCSIVNRWGEVVSEMLDINETWNGKNLKGNDCEAGVYFYTIEISCNGTAKNYQGFIHLVR